MNFSTAFVTIALPRVRDFRGISGRSFDGRGNYNIGVKEQIIFPEVEYDKVDALRGLNISITTTAKSDDECKALLAAFPFPIQELRLTVAKVSLIQRELKRDNWPQSTPRSTPNSRVSRTTPKRSDEERYAARLELQRLPRNAYPTRQRNRCA
jgi:hypothetical protein